MTKQSEWVAADEALALLAFGYAGREWRFLNAINACDAPYPYPSDALLQEPEFRHTYRAAALARRKRRLPNESQDQRERAVEDLLTNLPELNREIEGKIKALERVGEDEIERSQAGERRMYVTDTTAGPMQAPRSVPGLFFEQGMTINVLTGELQPRNDLPHAEGHALYLRAKEDHLGRVYFKRADLGLQDGPHAVTAVDGGEPRRGRGRPATKCISIRLFETRRADGLQCEVTQLAEAKAILKNWPNAGPAKPKAATVSGHIAGLWKRPDK
jgi:hypothetical protein